MDNLTSEERNFARFPLTYREVMDMLNEHGYPLFYGPMNPTLFGIRTNDNYTNGFTDVLGVLWNENGMNKIITVRGTTKPGLYGDGAITAPKKIHGITGTAVMVPGHYRGLWRMENFDYFGHENTNLKCPKIQSFNPWWYPYLHQVGACKLYRDGNMDSLISKEIVTDSLTDNINYHYMGNDITPNTYLDDNLNNWSLGCQGAPANELVRIFEVLYRTIPHYGRTLSYSLMEIV